MTGPRVGMARPVLEKIEQLLLQRAWTVAELAAEMQIRPELAYRYLDVVNPQSKHLQKAPGVKGRPPKAYWLEPGVDR